MKNSFTSLAWDTDYFGIPSARINLYQKLTSCEEIIEFSKNYKFITIYNYNNDENNNFLLRNLDNIFLADMNVHLEKKCNSVDDLDENIKISNNVDENKSLLEIAQNSFLYSRFINDKNLNSQKSANVYYHWTKNSFNKEEKYFCICENVGFLLFSINSDDKLATIELIAVDKDHKGKSVGTKLIRAFENYCYKLGIEKLEVGTQINNIIAQNFYQKNGYKITQYNSIYHYWR